MKEIGPVVNVKSPEMTLKLPAELRYCVYKHPNSTTYRYVCFEREICCRRGNGCCPMGPARYLQSWTFWLCVLFAFVTVYLICWYCKKIEKARQIIRNNNRVAVASGRADPTGRAAGVDRVLENLIRNYRNQLLSENSRDSTPVGAKDPPPEYTEAVTMAKPPDENRLNEKPATECVVAETKDEEAAPSYEQAVKICK
ncbi:uncharacterized protein LOC132706698 [Cylas formicarius]|uniref:uncharacterized protein LOC132706698 n=1 Tax=Cylas formicarius TaxID=197179 RepID=UPI0029584BB4|nr:uncharacterized protein LOC132706698 [Cylas formicarius]